ncbi:hypothetical protein [uncultured Sneathia sp.]|uniref:hypothetical protein n=1 Tax=uncultured Sneathia sp. TaxID=278067 RepID=UPI002595A586|nr:hypothetical protein [uncultured Sneathia sp.]
MKKTLLLASLITTVSMASTGFVESNFKGDLNFTKADDMTVLTGNLDELSHKGEVKVNKLTLGAVLKNKDIKEISKVKPLTTEMYTENLLDNSSVYAKYELPEFSGIKSYVKGTLNPKAPTEDGKHNFKKGNVELEGQLAHSFSNGVEVSLTSKTKFPFEKKDGEYGKAASSEHTLKLGAKKLNNFEDLEASLTIGHVYAKDGFRKAELNAKGTYVGLKDTKLNGEFNFIDEKEDDGKKDKNMAVSLKAGANYKGVKDLELDGKFNFKYQVKGTSKVKDIITDSDIVLNKDAYAHSYELDAKYTGVKDLELTAGAFVQHIHFDEGGISNYISSPAEYLYTQGIMSGDKDFIANKLSSLANAKKELENAKKELENLSDADKEEYKNAEKEYKKLVEDKKASLNKSLSAAQKNFNNETDATRKAIAQKSYEMHTALNQLTKKEKELEAEKKKINDEYQNLVDGINDKFANKQIFENKKKDIDKQLADVKAKKTELETQIADGIKVENANSNANVANATSSSVNTGLWDWSLKKFTDRFNNFVNRIGSIFKTDPKDIGKYLADSEYDLNNFDEEEFKKDDKSRYSKNGETYEENNIASAGKTPNQIFNEIGKTKYGKALEKVKKYNLDLEKKYKEKVEATKMFTAKLDLVNFGFKLGAKYTGVKNLTLTADGVFAGRHHSGFNQLFKYPSYTTGYVKLHTGAKYDFKLLNDKLVVSPEANVTATFADIYAGMVNPSLVLAPKVSVEYNPMETLKVSGSVEVPVNFGRTGINEFGYQSTSIKGAFNMKYEWK